VATPANGVQPETFAGEPYYPGFYVSDRKLQRIGLTHPINGPTQEAYDNGTDSLYVESLGVIIRSNLEKAGWNDNEIGSFPGGIYTGSPTGPIGSDPVAMVRKRLKRGDLRDAGTAEVDGRSVRRLVHGGFEYDVDAKTFEPVRVRQFSNWVGHRNSQKPPERMAEDANFEVFETLPLNSETEDLLKIDAPPTTKVIDAQGPDEQRPRQGRSDRDQGGAVTVPLNAR
jgi:hypothetical protein